MAYPVISDYGWTIDTEKNTATIDFSNCIGEFEDCNNYQVSYTNDGGANYINTGIYLTYDDGTTTGPATVTSVSITVDDVTYTSGNVIITPETKSIIYTVSGTDFAGLSEDNILSYALGWGCAIASDYDWEVDTEKNTATKDYSEYISQFENCNNYQVCYSNDGGTNCINTGIYLTYNDGTEYSVNIDSAITNGIVTADKSTAEAGETVQLNVSAKDGYELDKLTVTYGEDQTVETTKQEDGTYHFTMPAANVTVNATFAEIKVPEITGVTLEESTAPAGGSPSADMEIDTVNKQYIFTVSPGEIARVWFVIEGTNLDKPTSDSKHAVKTGDKQLPLGGYPVTEDDANGFRAGYMVEAGKLTYTNDGTNWIDTGWTVVIKQLYAVEIDSAIENGIVTADKSEAQAGDTVTLTVSAATSYELDTLTVTYVADGYEEELELTDENTFTMPASDVTVTATFKALSVSSVEITWGSMAFTYSDESNAWTNDSTDETAGTVTVKNTGDTTITASAKYEAEADYTAITGTISPESKELTTADNEGTFTLTLSGKPEAAITAGTKIGEITITLN